MSAGYTSDLLVQLNAQTLVESRHWRENKFASSETDNYETQHRLKDCQELSKHVLWEDRAGDSCREVAGRSSASTP